MKNNFKIRCSAIGQIMTNGKKPGELSKTCQSYLQTWAKEQIYERRKEIASRYMDKGSQMEDEAIDFLITHGRIDFEVKNEINLSNEFMTGTPDIIFKDEIIDIKCSWDCFTFPLFDSDLENTDYFYQLQGYMALTGKRKARLIYVLMNTPENLVNKEIYYAVNDSPSDAEKIAAEIRKKHFYDSVPVKYRIKEFSVYFDQEVITQIQNRVIECRNYLDSL